MTKRLNDIANAPGLSATVSIPPGKESEAARQILAQASEPEWAAWVRLALAIVVLAEQMDQAREVWVSVRARE